MCGIIINLSTQAMLQSVRMSLLAKWMQTSKIEKWWGRVKSLFKAKKIEFRMIASGCNGIKSEDSSNVKFVLYQHNWIIIKKQADENPLSKIIKKISVRDENSSEKVSEMLSTRHKAKLESGLLWRDFIRNYGNYFAIAS